jgi:hypothetical protein
VPEAKIARPNEKIATPGITAITASTSATVFR